MRTNKLKQIATIINATDKRKLKNNELIIVMTGLFAEDKLKIKTNKKSIALRTVNKVFNTLNHGIDMSYYKK